MHRDLLDALRCPHDHEESWLVAVVHRIDGGRLLDAELACPVCAAEFPVRDGVATFGAAIGTDAGSAPDPTRLAALLGVVGGHQPILLTGAYTRAGAALAELIETPQVWLDAPGDIVAHPLASPFRGASRLPLGVDAIAAAAIDPAHTAAPMFASILRAIRLGGRVLVPVPVTMPPGLRELARDDREWVAETTTRASGLVELRRRASDVS